MCYNGMRLRESSGPERAVGWAEEYQRKKTQIQVWRKLRTESLDKGHFHELPSYLKQLLKLGQFFLCSF